MKHGTVYAYRRKGCRCAACGVANNEAQVHWRANRRARGDQYIRKDRSVDNQNLRRPCSACGEVTRSRQDIPVCKPCQVRRKRGTWISLDARLAIYERDGWTCQFCGDAVGRTVDFNDPSAPTLDHITPRSLGGSDDPANLRTLHRYCNLVRFNSRALTLAELAS